MYIAVARLGAAWFDTHGEDSLAIAYELESFEHVLCESIIVEHKLVARCHHYHSIGIALGYHSHCPRHTWCSVAADRFGDEVFFWHVGQLKPHHVGILLVGSDDNVFLR